MFNEQFSHRKIAIGSYRDFRKFSIVWAFVILASGTVLAQEPAVSWDQLKAHVAKGDEITLLHSSGKRITGWIEQITPEGLDLRVSNKTRTFAEKDIRLITRKKQDSILNGTLIGAGVGFGPTLPICLKLAEDDDEQAAVIVSALIGFIGAGIGAIVDAFITQEQMIYFRPKSNVSWSVCPFYSNFPSRYHKPGPGAGAFLPDSLRSAQVDTSKGLAVTIHF